VTEVLDLTPSSTYQAKFWGFGSDGTVGANKQAIKIIGNHTDMYAQAYFSYDSKKSGGLTNSHLRFGKEPIDSTYLIEQADFIGCHNASYIHQYDLLKGIKPKGIFLLNTTWNKDRVLKLLPKHLKKELARKQVKFYIINAMEIAQEVGLGRRINTVMSTAFFELTTLLKREEFVTYLKEEVSAAYGKKSQEIVKRNHLAIDQTFDHLIEVEVPTEWAELELKDKKVDLSKPQYVREILEPINRQEGDSLTVKNLVDNQMTDGSVPLGTTAYEKRGIALEVPEWQMDACTMCNECAFVCPHAAIRPFLADSEELENAPEGYLVREMKGADGLMYRIQVSLEDCTGCGLCVDVCPAKEKALIMKPYEEQKEEALNWAFAMTLKQKVNPIKKKESIKGSQFEKPLLEFSGACSGCGETPYIKLLTQLYGDRMLIANATGCASIWGGSAPSTPYTTNEEGQGPAWSNSLFEDNAEFGFGMYLANQTKREHLAHLIEKAISDKIGSSDLQELMKDWLGTKEVGEGSRQRSTKLEALLKEEVTTNSLLESILREKDLFVKPSQWIIGGDGWAYDIGFGGIDHVLSSGEDVNIFVMDNEVYSNTGGQTSKATPTAAIAKFSSNGKRTAKKDLGLIAMTYGNVYVAQVALNANPMQTIKALDEAEKFPGPSLIIGYVPCINHGIKGGMSQAVQVTKEAVESGYWPLYRFDPRLTEKGKEPLRMDYKKSDFDKLPEFFKNQTRFSALENVLAEEEASSLLEKSADEIIEKAQTYKELSGK
jgi:pyruvate-ferredoxin/flavodoxin oxidoreductase